MRSTRSPLLALLVLALALIAPQGAVAAETFGEPFTLAPTANLGKSMTVQVRNPDGSQFAGSPRTGVITSVTLLTSGSAGTLKLLFLRPTGPIGAIMFFKKIAPDVPAFVTADASAAGHLTKVLTRVPVIRGDRVGIESPNYDINATQQFSALGNAVDLCGYKDLTPPWPVGDEFPLSVDLCLGSIPAVRATVERDADGDGYGDETQDSCLGDPTAHLPVCPARIVLSLLAAGKSRASEAVQRSFRLTNAGGLPASNVELTVKSSKPVKRLRIVKGCKPDKSRRRCAIASIAPGAVRTIKVAVSAGSANRAKLTVGAGGAKASTTVRFRRAR